MISFQEKQFFASLYEKLADALDLTDAQYDLANEKFLRMGSYLSEPGSLLARFYPQVLLQGSLRVGIAVRPVNEEDEFDVDMTCILNTNTTALSQFDLKELFRIRLQQDSDYRRMLDEEHRRCWRIKYAEATRFHLDVVPAIPDDFSWITAQGVPYNYAKHAINITDNKSSNYKLRFNDWPKSNTEGFALWFLDVMKEQLTEAKKMMSQVLNKRIDDIPDFKARTPLQRAIQILKRHRDLHFADDCDDKPVSIIITTLAARAYQGQANLYDALIGIIDRMPLFIEQRIIGGVAVKWVPNPVNPRENFADKWQVEKQRETKFYGWLKKVKEDLSNIEMQKGIYNIGETLKPLFGTRVVNDALNGVGKNLNDLRESKNLTAAVGTATLGIGYSKSVPKHTFDGTKE
ncbi:nucleotidyltransferase [Pedobacter sp. JY14-1]|uniref:nucleotidyltransferase domain-containing protein n=1 Tax=Pedobacter sp. JY14-1 TaxID=3034151 RepID=UPI0023E1A3F8|nr:nucleotidyltransferase [Pedobacter sp. JY14-1]